MDQPASAVGLAFGLAIGAGAASALGAAAVFFTHHTNTRFLAAALSISAGVMLYVSFVEIFPETTQSFEHAGYTSAEANRYSTLCFFAGMLVVWLLDRLAHGTIHLVHYLRAKLPTQDGMDTLSRSPSMAQPQAVQELARVSLASLDRSRHTAELGTALSNAPSTPFQLAHTSGATPQGSWCPADAPPEHPAPLPRPDGPSPSPSPSLTPHPSCTDIASSSHVATTVVVELDTPHDLKKHHQHDQHHQHQNQLVRHVHGYYPSRHHPDLHRPSTVVSEGGLEGPGEEVVAAILEADTAGNNGLSRLGLLAALAIGLHNLPEGMATFVGTLADTSTGYVIAFAIAMHNIPEGIVVAMSIYFATGSRRKAFLWGLCLSLTEPLGALLAYLILLGQELHPLVLAIMFGLVGGMMVCIALVELLPKAVKYDQEDKVTTKGLVVGMVIMAASLLLFDV